jgi:HEAT repeat protein
MIRQRILIVILLLTMSTTLSLIKEEKPSPLRRTAKSQIEIPPISDGASLGRVMSVMSKGDPEGIQAFIKMLRRPDPPSQGTAAWALAQMRSKNPDAVPWLIPMLKDDWLADDAATALGVIGPEARAAVPSLISVLKSQYRQNRRQAAEALGKIGNAKEAVPALREAMNDREAEVRIAASFAVYKLDAQSKKEMLAFLIETLRTGLRKPFDSGTFWAVKALGEIGPEAKEAVPVLLTAYKTHRSSSYLRLDDALRRIAPELWKR